MELSDRIVLDRISSSMNRLAKAIEDSTRFFSSFGEAVGRVTEGNKIGTCQSCKGNGKVDFPSEEPMQCIQCNGRGWVVVA